MQDWLSYLTALVSIVSLLIAKMALVRSSRWHNADEAQQLEKRLSHIEEQQLEHMPDHQALGALRTDVATLTERLAGLDRIVLRLDAVVQRLEGIHLREGRE